MQPPVRSRLRPGRWSALAGTQCLHATWRPRRPIVLGPEAVQVICQEEHPASAPFMPGRQVIGDRPLQAGVARGLLRVGDLPQEDEPKPIAPACWNKVKVQLVLEADQVVG